jgi:hypothetical protein
MGKEKEFHTILVPAIPGDCFKINTQNTVSTKANTTFPRTFGFLFASVKSIPRERERSI